MKAANCIVLEDTKSLFPDHKAEWISECMSDYIAHIRNTRKKGKVTQ
jgi:hypothetical protein